MTIQIKKTLDNQGFRSFKIGAGDGNRTHAISLEGWSSTIELHPQRSYRDDTI
jgi:hypothetical protein